MWSIDKGDKTQYRERFLDPMTGKQKIFSVTIAGKDTRKNRKLAEEALQEKAAAKLGAADGEKITLRAAADLYFSDQLRTVSLSTAKRNMHTMNTVCKILGGDILLNKITAAYIRRKFNETGDSNGTLNERITRLKAFFRWAYRNDLVDDITFLDKLQLYENQEKKERRAAKYLEADELHRLLDGMSLERWRNLCYFQALSGLRIGECVALEIGDVDLEAREIRVNKTFDANNEIVVDPKTAASNRSVYIQDELLQLCKRINTERKKHVLQSGDSTPYFFYGINGAHMEYYSYNKYLRENAQRILGRDITSHALRHTHVALMAEAGASLEAISRRCGHEHSRVTQDVYMHVTKKMQQKYNAEFEKIRIL